MSPGDRIRLKDGSEAVITSVGLGEPCQIRVTVTSGEYAGTTMALMSNELKRRRENA